MMNGRMGIAQFGVERTNLREFRVRFEKRHSMPTPTQRNRRCQSGKTATDNEEMYYD